MLLCASLAIDCISGCRSKERHGNHCCCCCCCRCCCIPQCPVPATTSHVRWWERGEDGCVESRADATRVIGATRGRHQGPTSNRGSAQEWRCGLKRVRRRAPLSRTATASAHASSNRSRPPSCPKLDPVQVTPHFSSWGTACYWVYGSQAQRPCSDRVTLLMPSEQHGRGKGEFWEGGCVRPSPLDVG